MVELISYLKEIDTKPIFYEKAVIEYIIKTNSKRKGGFNIRHYKDVFKIPHYGITELEEQDKKTAQQVINEHIDTTEKFCERHGQQVITWKVLY